MDSIVYQNALDSGFGVVFTKDKNLIAYVSRQLKVHERKYPKLDLEFATECFLLRYGGINSIVFSVRCLMIIVLNNTPLLKRISIKNKKSM